MTNHHTGNVASRSILRRDGARPVLTVDGEPFLVLGAELHNSSGSSRAAIEAGLDQVAAVGANTALVPVSWELIEPIEGVFNFEHVTFLLEEARSRNLRLGLLWFGTWKNGMSSYVPGWVKTNPQRFTRAVRSDGAEFEHLTPFCSETRKADSAAFAQLMSHLAATDAGFGTVILVQVENEVGLLGDSRDRSELATLAFSADVPPVMLDVLAGERPLRIRSAWEARGRRTSGSWTEIFGPGIHTDEAFMAFAYASYVEHVARCGRARYEVPLFVNAWLDSGDGSAPAVVAGGERPGNYPSGGPITSVAPIWRTAAPSLDFLAPDIYLGDFGGICADFSAASDGTLFIPEMRRDEVSPGQMAVALGKYRAIGVSPFGIDSGQPDDLVAITDIYALASSAAGTIAQAGDGTMAGFHLNDSTPQVEVTVAGQPFLARRHGTWGGPPTSRHAWGIIMATGEDEFLGLGRGFQLVPLAGATDRVGILRVEELHPLEGRLRTGRTLNGDETMSGSVWVHPALGPAAPGPIPIAAEGHNSGITRCSLYHY